jgi:hypothetical protein
MPLQQLGELPLGVDFFLRGRGQGFTPFRRLGTVVGK